MTLAAFDYQPRTRIVFGPGTVDRVGEMARELGARKALLVTDPGIVAAGHAARVIDSLRQAGVEVVCYDKAEENPTTRCVEKCTAEARKAGIDCFIGLGGGSSMDTAKGCNFLFTNGGRMQDYHGIGKARLPMLPLIAIPTTGGTGSECQSFALITDEQTHQKMACGDPKAAARVAILDPSLTVSQPPRVTACTGIDAIAHAVETAVTTKCTPFSSVFSREAFALLASGFPRVLENPKDLKARGQVLLGAAYAGTAIENSMLGAAHSAANPLTARFGLVHGQAVGLMLPHIVRFNGGAEEVSENYAELLRAARLCDPQPNAGSPASLLADWLAATLARAGLKSRLADFGVSPKDLPSLAEEAAKQWTAKFNPRTIGVADFEEIYRRAL